MTEIYSICTSDTYAAFSLQNRELWCKLIAWSNRAMQRNWNALINQPSDQAVTFAAACCNTGKTIFLWHRPQNVVRTRYRHRAYFSDSYQFNLQAMSCCENPSVADNAAPAPLRTNSSYNTLPRPGVLNRLHSADDTHERYRRLHMRLTAGQTAWWNRLNSYRYINRKQYRCIVLYRYTI